MKILIVDDDRFVIAALKKKIKWDELGFSDVLSAHSMSDAQKLIVSDSPEIIITDINMPQGSGLDLLAWIKEHRKNMISILLTSYADFEYAQKAIELGAFNYVLKPIDSEEITKIILSAVKEFQKQNLDSEEKYQIFWRKLLSLRSVSQSEITEMYNDDGHFTPLLFTFTHYYIDENNNLKSRLPLTQRDKLAKVFKESFSDVLCSGDVFMPLSDKGHLSYAAILNGSITSNSLYDCCSTFIDTLRKGFNCPTNIYVGNLCTASAIVESIELLYDLQKKRLKDINKIRFLSEETPSMQTVSNSKAIPAAHIDYMEKCLFDGNYDALVEYSHQYLEEISEAGAQSFTAISNFQIDFIQALYACLREKGISANHLYQDNTFHELSSEAVFSIYNMELYLQYMLNTAENFFGSRDVNKSVGKIIKDYVDKHYMENINRQSLSQILYLDPDYASRLFKNEIGTSFTNYVIEKRIEAAQDLLRTTTLPISTIASEVGYDNYSYFTRIFKKSTGFTPIEYRMSLKLR